MLTFRTMKTNLLASTFLCTLLLPCLVHAQAKLEFPAPSPACTLKQRVGLTDVEVNYSRPSARGRQVFGGVVPYGVVWRTGANASTKISVSTPVKLCGHELPEGKYALYTIPGEDEWTIIISKNLDASVFNYDQKDDLVRFKVEPHTLAENVETFTIEMPMIRDDSAMLCLLWENTLVPINIELDLTSKLVPQIEAAMSEPGDRKPYYQAAMFYFDHNLDIQKARKWLDAIPADRETYYILHLKAKVLAKAGDKPGAIAAAKHSSELAVKAEGPKSGYVKMNQDLVSSLQ
jgi:hypothetical protein